MGARSGQHHNAAVIATDTLSGAASGAAIGTLALPGIGTAVGAGVGAIGGFLGGLFGGDEPDPLPQPEAPPAPEDLATTIARRGEVAKQMRLMADGSGTILSGPGGDTSAVPGSAPRAKAA